jgi:hypothetical protein
MAFIYCSKDNFGQLGSAPKSLRHQETIALDVTDMDFLLFMQIFYDNRPLSLRERVRVRAFARPIIFYTEPDRIAKT